VLRVAPLLLLGACSWFTDFKQQPKIDPWESGSDTIPFRGNPQMSVSVYGSAAPGFMYDRAPTPQAVATMASLTNPVAPDSASVNRGRIQYQINCAVCHGPTAAGNGITKQYGLATVVSLQDERIRKMADGEIFNTITNGKNTMLAYGPNVGVSDRWAIITYLRALQRSQNATEADVPPEHRAELDKPPPAPSPEPSKPEPAKK
jgi:mono/diheme cytochrome c family protein